MANSLLSFTDEGELCPSLPSEEYHIIILVEELSEMGVKANTALYVDVTGTGYRSS